MKAADICRSAAKLIEGDRAIEWGNKARMCGRIADVWSAYLGVPIAPHDAAMMLALMKAARIRHRRDEDSYIDAAGYIAIAGEVDQR